MERFELGSGTLWAFVACSHEARHLDDIIFGVDVLRQRGVPDANILVFVDHAAPEAHLHPYGIKNIYPPLELGERLAAAGDHASVVVVVTGHGSKQGLGDGTQLTPVALCAAIRRVPQSMTGVVVLGQCYAGIFNYLDVRVNPPLVVIGATNLNLSISSSYSLPVPLQQADGAPGLTRWQANLFLVAFFNWILNPTDVDGDGDLNLLDAYKYAGAASNQAFRSVKVRQYFGLGQRAQQVQIAQKSGKPLEIDAALRMLQDDVESLFLHQEPWILHAHRARDIHFSF